MEGNKALLQDMLFFKDFYFADHFAKYSKKNLSKNNPIRSSKQWEVNPSSNIIEDYTTGNSSNKTSFKDEESQSLIRKEDVVESDKIFTYDLKALLKKKSSSFLHRKMATEISLILGDTIEKNLEKYIENLVCINDVYIEQLKVEEVFNSIRIMGLEINTTAVNNLMVAIVSIVLTAYEIFVNK